MTFKSRRGLALLALIPLLQACGGTTAEEDTLQSESSPSEVVASEPTTTVAETSTTPVEESTTIAEVEVSESTEPGSESSGEENVAASPGPIDGWSTFESAEGGYSILLPDDGRNDTSQSVDTEVGAVTLSMTLAEIPGNRAYGASFTEYPADAVVDLDGAVDGSISNSMPGGTLVSNEEVTISGFACRRFVGAGKVQSLDAELASIVCEGPNKRLVQAIAVGPAGLADHPETQIFLDSFILNEA